MFFVAHIFLFFLTFYCRWWSCYCWNSCVSHKKKKNNVVQLFHFYRCFVCWKSNFLEKIRYVCMSFVIKIGHNNFNRPVVSASKCMLLQSCSSSARDRETFKDDFFYMRFSWNFSCINQNRSWRIGQRHLKFHTLLYEHWAFKINCDRARA